MKSKILRAVTVILVLFMVSPCSGQKIEEILKTERQYWKGDLSQFDKLLNYYVKGDNYKGELALILGKTRKPEAIPYLIETLRRGEPHTPQAITALEIMKNPAVIPYLIQLIKEDSPYAVNAVRSLGNLKDKRAVPILLRVVEEKRSYHLEAVNALGKIGDKRAIDTIMEYFLEPAESEPDEIRLRVLQEGKDPQKSSVHERIFRVEKNLPPRLEIEDFQIDPVGKVYVDYLLSDTELDTLDIVAEYSQDGGVSWLPATIEGRTRDFTGVIYRNDLVWRADVDSIAISPQTDLIFKITPTDRRNDMTRGVPALLDLNVDANPIGIRNIRTEVTGEIPLVVYYPAITTQQDKKFLFSYSFNNGRNWFPAATFRRTGSGLTTPDSITYMWRSHEDLAGDDFSNVIIRVSSFGDSTIGRTVVSEPFHVDNNEVPEVFITKTKENDFFEISYRIIDPEEDLVTLDIDYSTNEGRSWQRATISGDMSNLSPLKYEGVIEWYSDFDITFRDRDKPVRIRITPSDRDRGAPLISRDLMLNDPYYSKLTKGEDTGDISVRYNFASDDTARPVTQYSLDGGKTWEQASVTGLDIEREANYNKAGINWSMGRDINGYHRRMAAAAHTMDMIGDPDIVPDLLKIVIQRDSPRMSERQRAIEAARLFEKRPQWIIDGLINSLISDDPSVHVTAVQILETVDTPEVNRALQDYYAYWAQENRSEEEEVAMEQEDEYQELVGAAARMKIPTRQQLMNFLYKQGVTKFEAQSYFRDLDFYMGLAKLKEDLDDGRITQKEYDRAALKLLDDIRKRKHQQEREAGWR